MPVREARSPQSAPPPPVLLVRDPLSPSGPRSHPTGQHLGNMELGQGNGAIKMTFKLGEMTKKKSGSKKKVGSNKAKSSPKRAGKKSPGKSPGKKKAKVAARPTPPSKSRRQSTTSEGDTGKEKKIFSLDRTKELMKVHITENRAVSAEAYYTMAFAAEHFVYHIAQEALARADSDEIDYDSAGESNPEHHPFAVGGRCVRGNRDLSDTLPAVWPIAAKAVQEVPALHAFLSELLPPRMTHKDSKNVKPTKAATAKSDTANGANDSDDESGVSVEPTDSPSSK
eukprot:m.193332 g.193332  ORF g.193332 m.193332 type:complete len:283 (-) comp24978_c1_seq2:220-1068(-)